MGNGSASFLASSPSPRGEGGGSVGESAAIALSSGVKGEWKESSCHRGNF